MRNRSANLLIALAFLSITACDRTPTKQAPKEPEPIDRIAIVGHGLAFDAQMKAIPIDMKTIEAMQQSLGRVIGKSELKQDERTAKFEAEIKAAVARTEDAPGRALLNAALFNRQLMNADEKTRKTYAWRNTFLFERTRSIMDRLRKRPVALSEAVQRLLRDGLLIKPGLFDNDYMQQCRAAGVPIPPNFRMNPASGWSKQGNLTTNILAPGAPAEVWTWSDSGKRGACVALPRDGGGAGSLAGIICQSATTGNACFWDNMRRGDPARIPPATETMVIRELQDGFTLDEGAPCTGCHTGNNVFLMAPDDATWAKVMRGPLNGPSTGAFTTVYEPLANTVAGGPRYTPIAYPSWVNPPLTTNCAGSCHAKPSASIMTRWNNTGQPGMPPACATGGNFHNCYGTP